MISYHKTLEYPKEIKPLMTELSKIKNKYAYSKKSIYRHMYMHRMLCIKIKVNNLLTILNVRKDVEEQIKYFLNDW